jgi:7-cyano-7-deazaguanine reductase
LFLRGKVFTAFSRMGFYRTKRRQRMAQSSKSLETFPNPKPERDFAIHMQIPEFTCLCPKTGQPDFATLFLDYIPDKTCVELKSLKLYIWSFRDQGKFHEAVTNEILDHLVAATQPRFMRLTARFFVRGGIFTTVEAEHRKPGWTPAERVELASLPLESNIR